jgi:hypothetical protein
LSTHACTIANGSLSGTRFAPNVLLDWVYNTPGANCKCLLKMDEASWTGAANEILDATGNGHHGTKAGNVTQATDGWLNKEANFPGNDSTSKITLADHADWTQDEFTAQAWVLWNGVTSDTGIYSAMCPFMQGDSTDCAWGVMYFRSATVGNQIIRVYHNSAVLLTYTAPLLTTEHHLAITYSRANNRIRLWINGVLAKSAARAVATADSAYDPTIGREKSAAFPWAGRIDAFQFDAAELYTDTFFPVRYPASGTWTELAGEAEANCLPGVLTATLAAALPAGTSLKAKLLSAAGGDTGWQAMTDSGDGVTHTHDFSGAAAGDWRAAIQPFAGGSLNVNTPEVSGLAFDYSAAGLPFYLFDEDFYLPGLSRGVEVL